MFVKEYRKCWPDLREEHKNKRKDKERNKKDQEAKRPQKRRVKTHYPKKPRPAHTQNLHEESDKEVEVYDTRDRSRSQSQKHKSDRKRKAKVELPKPVKQKTTRGRRRHRRTSPQPQARNRKQKREAESGYSSSGRDSPYSVRAYSTRHSPEPSRRMDHVQTTEELRNEVMFGPNWLPPRDMTYDEQKEWWENYRAYRDGELRHERVLVNPDVLPRSQHGSVVSRPGASRAPSTQRTATTASSHRSRRRPRVQNVDEISPMSSAIELSDLISDERARRSPSPLSIGSPVIPRLKVTPPTDGPERSASLAQTTRHDYPAHRNDEESLLSQNPYLRPDSPAGYHEKPAPVPPGTNYQARGANAEDHYGPTTPRMDAMHP